jgi:hypothetical protein
MTIDDARAFAAEWIAAWNSHDLDRILSHYAGDIVFLSPFAQQLVGNGPPGDRSNFGRNGVPRRLLIADDGGVAPQWRRRPSCSPASSRPAGTRSDNS